MTPVGTDLSFFCLSICLDVAGGASVSLHSLMAATLGAAACAPLVMIKAGMWSSQARRRFPVLEALQRWQTESASPLVSHMSPAQVSNTIALPQRF